MSTHILGSAAAWGCREAVRWAVIQVEVLLAEQSGEEELDASDGKQSLPPTEAKAWTDGSPWPGRALQFFYGINVHVTGEI